MATTQPGPIKKDLSRKPVTKRVVTEDDLIADVPLPPDRVRIGPDGKRVDRATEASVTGKKRGKPADRPDNSGARPGKRRGATKRSRATMNAGGKNRDRKLTRKNHPK